MAERVAPHIGNVDECEFERMKEPFLTTGYRIGYDFSACLKSMFEWHNETLNIWTHFGGFIMVMCFVTYTYKCVVPKFRSVHGAMPLVFLLPSLGSMTSSTIFHIFRSISEPVYAAIAPFDFLFIAFVLVGMQIPLIYYAMYERPKARRGYFITLGLMLASAVTYIAIPKLILPGLRVLRTCIFVVLAVVALIARVHACLTSDKYPEAAKRCRSTMLEVFIAYFIAGITVIIYLFRFPERYYPGTFDNTLQSHILMHVLSMTSEVLFWHTMTVDIKAVTTAEASKKKLN